MSSLEVVYLRALAEQLHAARVMLIRLANQVYPSQQLSHFVSRDLAAVVGALLDCFDAELAYLESQPGAAVRAACMKAVALWQTERIQSMISVVSQADIHSHPLEVMLFIRDVVGELEGKDFDIITSPRDDLNFSFREVWSELRAELEQDFGLKQLSESRYIELTYPVAEKDNVLIASIYAHEIGHYIDRRKHLWSKVFLNVVAHHPHLVALKGHVQTVSGRTCGHVELMVLLMETVIGHWVREAIADCMGIRLLGPAFFFAATQIELLAEGAVDQETVSLGEAYTITHPRSSQRVRYWVSLLSSIGDAIPERVTSMMKAIESYWQGVQLIEGGPRSVSNGDVVLPLTTNVYQILESIWSDCLPEVTRLVDSVLPDSLRFTGEDYGISVRLAEERIQWLLPPNELGRTPVKASVIFNAGWNAALCHLQEMQSRSASLPQGVEGKHEVLKMLNGLLRYALHASHVQAQWGSSDALGLPTASANG